MNLLDEEGYPTDEFLNYIKNWKSETSDVFELVSLIEEAWWMKDMGFKLEKNKLTLHTLGWSGNESIIDAILSNIYLIYSSMRYEQWNAGGHYIFEVKID